MKQFLLLLLIIPFLSISQVQIGQDINGDSSGDGFGRVIDLSSDGTIMIVGSQQIDFNGPDTGQIKVFKFEMGVWNQLGCTINGTSNYDYFGSSVAISGDGQTIAVGATGVDTALGSTGQIKTYRFISNDWVQIGQNLNGVASGDQAGLAISLSNTGDIIAIGAHQNDANGSNSGHVRVFEFDNINWIQKGLDINGNLSGLGFGYTIHISDDGLKFAEGHLYNTTSQYQTGFNRTFEFNGVNWVEYGNGNLSENTFGNYVRLSSNGNILASGTAWTDTYGSLTGSLRIYNLDSNNNWIQIGSDLIGEASGDQFGSFFDLSSNGSIIAIGAPLNDSNGSNSGNVKVYENQSGVWTQVGSTINGSAAGDFFGNSVRLSTDSNILSIGGYNNDTNGSDSGHVRVYDLSGLTLASDNFVLENFSVSPNPTTDKVSITLTNNLELKAVSIYNYFGQKIKKIQSREVDLSSLSIGVYFLEIETNKGKASRKVVKK